MGSGHILDIYRCKYGQEFRYAWTEVSHDAHKNVTRAGCFDLHVSKSSDMYEGLFHYSNLPGQGFCCLIWSTNSFIFWKLNLLENVMQQKKNKIIISLILINSFFKKCTTPQCREMCFIKVWCSLSTWKIE